MDWRRTRATCGSQSTARGSQFNHQSISLIADLRSLQGRFHWGPVGPRPPVKFLPLPLCPSQKKFKIRPSLILPKFSESLLCISCHFNAFMYCDILMIYITYSPGAVAPLSSHWMLRMRPSRQRTLIHEKPHPSFTNLLKMSFKHIYWRRLYDIFRQTVPSVNDPDREEIFPDIFVTQGLRIFSEYPLVRLSVSTYQAERNDPAECDYFCRRVGVLCLSMRHLRCQG